MGVAISEIASGRDIDLEALQGKIIAIDTFNFLYQFLATIRGPDGSLLTNAKGDVTSHLVGLFARTTRLMEAGIKLVFIIDGEAPELKKKERERRKQLKEDAQEEYEIAKERHDFEAMKKFASRTSKLTPHMLEDAIELITLLGIPYIKAPSEGEAQGAYMASKGDVYAVASQDFDSLLFGAPVVIRNLSLTGRRKMTGKQASTTIMPVEVRLDDVLNKLGIDHNKLIALGIMVGTDFNYGGIKGIGPKKSLKLLKEHTIDEAFKLAGWQDQYETNWKDIFDLFKHIPTTNDYSLEWSSPHTEQLREILVNKHGFEESRITRSLEKLAKVEESAKQKGLSDFF